MTSFEKGMSAADVQSVSFPKPPGLRRGYEHAQVDQFLQRAARALEAGTGITADAVRGVRFTKPGIGSRGYDERSVDEFLDKLEAECVRRGWR